MIARAITIALAGFAVALTLLIWRNDARSSNLGTLVSMCNANPGCVQSNPDPDGAITFRVRQKDAVLRLTCSADGTCQRVAPKSARVSIVNPAQMISFR